MWSTELVPLPDGRRLEILMAGPEDALPLVVHGGTPGGPVPDPKLAEAAEAAGLRVIAVGRPGYGQSTPHPGRSVGDVAADVAHALDHLSLEQFVTVGSSGGGPHALACAALLPGRCLAAATIAGVAPWDAEGLDFLAGMGEENVEEFGLALEGRAVLTPWIATEVAGMGDVTPESMIAMFGSLLPPVDLEVLSGDVAEVLVASLQKAFEAGTDGWVDDDLAFTRPWGFDLAAITVPVTIWQGAQDRMVPFAHGQWLAANVGSATARLFDEHGHLSLAVAHLPTILKELVTRQ
jgi:pimeloyl-ACP methyl ester carboxylesterase